MESMLECPICTDYFDRSNRLPLVLLCGHTICKACAQLLMKKRNNIISCPLDRKEDSRPLSQISHSIHILELIEHISNMKTTIKYLKLNPEQRIQAMREQAKTNLSLINQKVSVLQAKIEQTNYRKQGVKKQIRSSFQQFKITLKNRETDLLEQVDTMFADHLKQFAKLQSELKRKMKEQVQKMEELNKFSGDIQNIPDIQAINNLPDIPTTQIKISFVCENTKTSQIIEKLGKVGKWDMQVPYECDHFRNVTYWMVPPCCYQHYCCNKCHDTNEDHRWVYANRMICMFCQKEQDYRKLPNHCETCNTFHKGVVSKQLQKFII